MKKFILSIAAFGLLYISGASAQTGQERERQEQPQVQTSPQGDQEGQAWQRSDENMWRGADNIWYRKEGEIIMKSNDGRTWQRTENNEFRGHDGTMYRYQDGELKTSRDGRSWEDADDWSDQDGKSFRFDEQGQLQHREGDDDARGHREDMGGEGMEGQEDDVRGQQQEDIEDREPGN
jgi:hypothetical protein